MTTETPQPHWERGWKVHGYWDAIPGVENGDVQVGRVCRPPGRSMGGEPYAWEYYFAGGLVAGVAFDLEKAKRQVEKVHKQHRAATLRDLKRKRGTKRWL